MAARMVIILAVRVYTTGSRLLPRDISGRWFNKVGEGVRTAGGSHNRIAHRMSPLARSSAFVASIDFINFCDATRLFA
jgi:hypothetical protein